MTKYDKLNEMLKRIQEEEQQNRENFAKICFDKLIIPICKKYNLNFICSMGTWYFEDKKENILDEEDVPDQDVVEFINATFFDENTPLYYYLGSIPEGVN